MSDKIAKLVPRAKAVNADCVRELETALALAKAGELQGVCIAGIYGDGRAFSTYSETDRAIEMVGAMTITLNRRIASLHTYPTPTQET